MASAEFQEVDTYQLLGFSARETEVTWRKQWDDYHEQTFLLRNDAGIIKPLSTDTTVWNSVFDVNGSAYPKVPRKAPNSDPLDLTSRRDTELWMSVRELESALVANDIRAKCAIVALTKFVHPTSLGNFWPKPDHPQTVDPAWRIIGFDVSDDVMQSGLTDCGYDAEEKPNLVARFASKLNAYHLFDTIDDACEFRDVADERSPGHAPFFVYGLWLVSGTL
ncbi:MAG TPA: hypothetical protein VGK19_19980 [Capsulimonadaceae bacterium]|jgi:hypothetical protein